MKKCNTCFKELDESLFYKGHAKCKECYIKKVKIYAHINQDRIRSYEKQRSMLPHRVELRAKYAKTKKGKDAVNKAKKRYLEHNLIKRASHIMLGNAIRDGKVTRKNTCETCGTHSNRIHGHHDDYSKPLDVRWLCAKCHSKWHKENGSGLNG